MGKIKPETVPVLLNLPKRVHRRFKVEAARHDTPMRRYMVECLTRYAASLTKDPGPSVPSGIDNAR